MAHCALGNLPRELLVALLGYLGPDDKRSLRISSKQMCSVVNETVCNLLLTHECAAFQTLAACSKFCSRNLSQKFPLLMSLTMRFHRFHTLSESISTTATMARFSELHLTNCSRLKVRHWCDRFFGLV